VRDARGFGGTLQSSHYDVAVATQCARRPHDGGEPLQLLGAGLRAGNLRIETLAFDALRTSTQFGAAAAKFLCIDEGLFDHDDGAEFAKRSVRVARKARRIVGLLCVDPARVFRNRTEIMTELGSQVDYIIGEPPAVLALFGVRRIDTLVPHMLRSGIGLIMHRVVRAPIFLWSNRCEVELGGEALAMSAFWSNFVPTSIARVLYCNADADVAKRTLPVPLPSCANMSGVGGAAKFERTIDIEIMAARIN
jgi:hypothetical protein